MAGYSLLYNYFIAQSDKHVIVQLDKADYKLSELVELKIALHSPYITNTKDYERMDGQIQLNHIDYNYVMRKVHSDTLYLLCLPNYNKTQLCNSKINYAKQANDFPSNKKSHDTGSKKVSSANDYDFSVAQYHLLKPIPELIYHNRFTVSSLPAISIATPWQPPQSA